MMCGTKHDTVSWIVYTLFRLRHNVGHVESYLNIESAKRA